MSKQLDQTYRREDISNFKKIEFGINGLYHALKSHEQKDKNAHDSSQIRYGSTTVKKM